MSTQVIGTPNTFSASSAGTTLTFAIPAGSYTSATLRVQGTIAGASPPYTLAVNNTVFAANAAGAMDQTIAVAASDLAAVNAMAGGNWTPTAAITVGGGTIGTATATLTLFDSSSQYGGGGGSQIKKAMDYMASWLKAGYALLGKGEPSETQDSSNNTLPITSVTTLGGKAKLLNALFAGDGTSNNAGIGNAQLQASVAYAAQQLQQVSQWPDTVSRNFRPYLEALKGSIVGNLPRWTDATTRAQVVWNFSPSAGITNPLDAALTRMNANSTSTPITPTYNPAVTAVNNANGAIPTGSGCVIVFTHVGFVTSTTTTADYLESLPSGELTAAALTGANNAWQIAGGGTVPSGVSKVRVYRTKLGQGTGSPKFWDQDVAVTAGTAYPAIILTQPDSLLRQDLQPPAWCSVMVTPEAAAIVASCYSGQRKGQGATAYGSLKPLSSMMLTPRNVVLAPSNGLLGQNNPPSSGLFGSWLSTVFTAGSMRTANNADSGLQGFGGAFGIQLRTTTAMNANAGVTITYTYLDQSLGGYGTPASQVATAVTLNSALGSTIAVAVTAGRLVLSVTACTVTGATTGAFVIEAAAPRSY